MAARVSADLVRLGDKAYLIAAQIMKVVPDTTATPGDDDLNWTKFSGLVSELVDVRNEMRTIHNEAQKGVAEEGDKVEAPNEGPTATQFEAALEELVETRDSETNKAQSGSLEAIVRLYLDLTDRGKREAKLHLSRCMVDSLEGEFDRAYPMLEVNRALAEVSVRGGSKVS